MCACESVCVGGWLVKKNAEHFIMQITRWQWKDQVEHEAWSLIKIEAAAKFGRISF